MNAELAAKMMLADVRRLVDAIVTPLRDRLAQVEGQLRAVGEIPPAISVVGATIDRSGHLILAQSNGAALDLGEVTGKDFDPATMELAIAQAIAAIPPVPVPTIDSEVIAQVVQDAVATLPVPQNGKDADPELIRSMVQAEMAALPEPPVPTIDPEAIAQAVQEAVAALPLPQNGKDADPEIVRAMIREAVNAIPVPANGKDADPDALRAMVHEAVEALVPVVATHVEKAVSAIPVAEAPIGISSAVINQAGHLLLTLSDGSQRDVGEVVGQSVDVDAVHQLVHRMFSEIPKPKDGRDGIATREELVALVRETVEVAVAPQVEAQVAKAVAELPRIEYKGVWTEGTYRVGDAVTFGGSIWMCRAAGTPDKPGTSDAWQLAVKKGRDGKGS